MSDDQVIFENKHNSLHILQQLMPDRPSSNYSLRARPHNKTLITKTTQLNDQGPYAKHCLSCYFHTSLRQCFAYGPRTSSLEVSIKTHIDSSIISTVILCMYITAPPVNNSMSL